MKATKHDEWLAEQLKDAAFAAEFLNAASEDDDPKTYLTALRKVVEARCGMAAGSSTNAVVARDFVPHAISKG